MLQACLHKTDYVITKIAEAQIIGDTEAVEQLKQKYVTQLQQRETIRAWNEQMKQSNKQCKEELRSMEIRYG
jgi:hypothetical protein